MVVPLLLAFTAWTSELPPDVVLVVGDDIALTDVDAIETPYLDVLADEGVSFRRAYAHPLCAPTRRSALFGRWPGRSATQTCVPADHRTPHHSEYGLAKLMKGAGYATGAFGKWHLSGNFLTNWEVSPNLHGFDVWRAGLPTNVSGCGGQDYSNWTRVDDGVSGNTTEYQTTAVRDAFISWWVATPRPRFAYVCYQAAHVPLHVPPRPGSGGGGPPPPGGLYTDREKYELMVQSLDESIGDMLSVVDPGNTIFVFVGDNGTPSAAVRADQDRDKVKRTTFRDGIRVPFLMTGPGIVPGESEALVHVVDLMATIGELIGAPPPDHLGLDSSSFAGALVDPLGWRPEREFVFCENGQGGGLHDMAVVTERWKLRNLEGAEELYDLRFDPDEVHPLDLDDPGLRELLACLREIMSNPSSPCCKDIPER